MNANDITAKRFGKATFNGYNTDDVDAFLREVSHEFSQLIKEKSELERKLEVLADKIREYRDDEDALKDALLLAQKQGNSIIAEAKASSEQLKTETREECDKQISDAQEQHDTLISEGQERHDTLISEGQAQHDKLVSDGEEYKAKLIKETNDRADAMIKEARSKTEEMRRQMNDEREKLEKILVMTRREAYDYRTRLLSLYKSHMDVIEQIPEKVENDFVKRIAEQAEKAAEEVAPEQPEPITEQPKQAPAEAPAKEVEKPADISAEIKPQPEKSASQELPFFNSAAEPKVRHTDLHFGQNNNGSN
ncbi:MAG: DivIVA domain-containing protein [Oscillospiraceae bacterium]